MVMVSGKEGGMGNPLVYITDHSIVSTRGAGVAVWKKSGAR